MTNEQKENIVTSDQVAPKTTPKKTQKKVVKQDQTESIENLDKVLIYFESGMAYLTTSGVRFSREENRMAEVSAQEASSLLRLPNFRLPSDEEKEFYYNNLEA